MNCIFSNSDCNGDLKHRMPLAAIESSAAMCEYHWTLRQHDVRVAASTGCTCWEGYERVPGTKPCAPGSCRKKSSIEKEAIDPMSGIALIDVVGLGGLGLIGWNEHRDSDKRKRQQYFDEMERQTDKSLQGKGRDDRRKDLMRNMMDITRGETPNNLRDFDPKPSRGGLGNYPSTKEWDKQLDTLDAQQKEEKKPRTQTFTPDQLRSQTPALPRGFASTQETAGIGEAYDAVNQWAINNPAGWDAGLIAGGLLAGGKLLDSIEKKVKKLHKDHVDEHHETEETQVKSSLDKNSISLVKTVKEITCGNCDGAGSHFLPIYQKNGETKDEERPCYTCQGTGTIFVDESQLQRELDKNGYQITEFQATGKVAGKEDDEIGFLEEQESFRGTTDDDTDVKKTPRDPNETMAEEVFQDRYDDEEESDDENRTDKTDMIEDGRLDSVAASVKCAACGTSSCDGHASDSIERAILVAHASGDHASCSTDGCDSPGRSFHAHVCTNCGGDTPCSGVRTASACDTFDGFCKTCFVSLAGIKEALDKKELNKHMRDRNTGAAPVTQAEIDRAMAQGHSLETAREEVGPHRPPVEGSKRFTSEFDMISENCPNCGNDDHGLWDYQGSKMDGSDLTFTCGGCNAVFKAGDYMGDELHQSWNLGERVSFKVISGDDSFVPPSSVASNAKRGLELRKKHNRGGTEVGVARARDLSNRKGLSYKTVKRMKAYFDRHEVDKKGKGWGKDSAGYIAWLLWGGDSGRSWANKIIKQREKKASTECETCGQSSFVCNCNDNYNDSAKFASNECGTCGHGWASHGNSQTCSCCKDFKKASINELPDWLKEAALQIESDAKIIDLDSYRKKTPQQEAMYNHPSMQAPKKTELYDQDDELKLYDQDREVNPIPNTETNKTTLREQMKAIGDWLGLTDDSTAPYDRRTDPREYGL